MTVEVTHSNQVSTVIIQFEEKDWLPHTYVPYMGADPVTEYSTKIKLKLHGIDKFLPHISIYSTYGWLQSQELYSLRVDEDTLNITTTAMSLEGIIIGQLIPL